LARLDVDPCQKKLDGRRLGIPRLPALQENLSKSSQFACFLFDMQFGAGI
jgi:hypothetical protein